MQKTKQKIWKKTYINNKYFVISRKKIKKIKQKRINYLSIFCLEHYKQKETIISKRIIINILLLVKNQKTSKYFAVSKKQKTGFFFKNAAYWATTACIRLETR